MTEKKKLIYEDEKILNLADVFFYLLGKWKMMVLAAVIFAVLAGGFSFVKSSSHQDPSKEAIELSKEELEAYQTKISKIEEYRENVQERDYYLENSILAKLDPNGYYEGTITCIFSVESGSEAIEAAELCRSRLLNLENLGLLSEKLSEAAEAAMLSEVVFFEEDESFVNTPETARLVLKAQHYKQDDCEIMLSFFTEKLQEIIKALEAQGNGAKATLFERDIRLVSDPEKMLISSEMLKERENAYNNLTAAEESLTEAEKAFFQTQTEGESEAEGENAELQEPFVSKKLMLAGALAGAFFAAAYYTVRYLFSGKVHNKEELESWLAIPVLEMEQPFDITAAMLAEMAEKSQAKKLYLTGSREKLDEETVKALCTALAEKKVEVTCGRDGLKTAEALRKMNDCGFIVFVEACNESKEKDIREEIEKASSCGAKILGIVLEK